MSRARPARYPCRGCRAGAAPVVPMSVLLEQWLRVDRLKQLPCPLKILITTSMCRSQPGKATGSLRRSFTHGSSPGSGCNGGKGLVQLTCQLPLLVCPAQDCNVGSRCDSLFAAHAGGRFPAANSVAAAA